MTIDPKYLELIQADIDGEIDAAGRVELDRFLADSTEGRDLHAEFSAISRLLDELPELEPPAHLKRVIMNQIPAIPMTAGSVGFFKRLFAGPTLGYVGTFAAGVAFALVLVTSDQISTGAFDDVTGLVGTMADGNFAAPEYSSVPIQTDEVAGRVTLRTAGSLMILDFDLTSSEPVQIRARYADRTIWFNGFAQLESSGTSVAAETGAVMLTMDGKRRYAVFLNNPGNRPTTIEMQFVARGQVVHEVQLEFGG